MPGPLPDGLETALVLGDLVIPAGAGRQISQTLTRIEPATQLRRTVNGDLIDISSPLFRKYATTITCSDMAAPSLDDIWPGDELEVDCIVELSGTPSRPVASTRDDGETTFWCPRLTMIVQSIAIDTDEWGARIGWSISLEEV